VLATLVLSALVAQATAFRIDPATAEAGFDLKATAHTVHGTTPSVSGDVRVQPAADGSLALSGTIEIGTASLRTGNDRRDATMHEKSLLTPSYPAIAFAPERFTPSGPAGAGGAVPGLLAGRITIRGQTRPQTMTATLTPRGERIEASGTFDVRWAEFGVPDPSFFVVRIESVAHAHFRATFAPVP
jgi:polyisoprenoid-binding protein YceI